MVSWCRASGKELQKSQLLLGVRASALGGDDGEADEHVGLIADLREYLRFRVAGDIARHGEGSVGA